MISKNGKDFAIMMEKVNDGFFTHWNNRMRIFREDDTEDILDGSILDKHLYDRKGRMCSIELKTRDADINTFDTLFIEEKKWDEFKEPSLKGATESSVSLGLAAWGLFGWRRTHSSTTSCSP